MMDALNYDEISVPEGKNPLDYDSIERRADLLRIIYRVGHPYCRSAGCARTTIQRQQQISKDMQAIRDFMSINMGSDLEVRAVSSKQPRTP